MQWCPEPGCGVLVPHGRCPDHRRESFRAQGYTARWDRRALAFRKRYPLCGMRPNMQPPVMSQCYDEDRVTLAAQVDHVVPHRGDKRLMWDEINNWQSLCRPCHTRKTNAGA